MITEALRHLPGIGRVRLARLHELGIRTWDDVLMNSETLPFARRAELVAECDRCLAAMQAGDVRYFVENLDVRDRWRILSEFLAETTFFDIETEGLDYDARITVIGCWHRGELKTFIEHENLDEFLDLLDDVKLLASFNGSTFDVPRVLDAFHIPSLPCPHLDVRWMCFHQGWKGSLKEIGARAGIMRPADLRHADGALAVRLWNLWRYQNNQGAREQLLRYCAADVVLLAMLAHRLAGFDSTALPDLWSILPARSSQEVRTIPSSPQVGFGNLDRLRGLRVKFAG